MAIRTRDPFLLNYTEADLKVASEFLSNWLPFLSRGLCRRCTRTLSNRIRSFGPGTDSVDASKQVDNFILSTPQNSDVTEYHQEHDTCEPHSVGSLEDNGDMNDNADTNSLGSWKDAADEIPGPIAEASTSEMSSLYVPAVSESSSVKVSWADMAQEDELEGDGDSEVSSLLGKGSCPSREGTEINESKPKAELSWEQREYLRFRNLERKKDFICFERVNGKFVNILDGLELHSGVFSAAEQKRIVNFVEELQEQGKNGLLKERTYTAPQKWMKGKGRVTIQFGCCYNYATDKNGNPPGILKNGSVDPLPQLFKVMIRRLVRWHVMPPSCVPDSCIVNIYDEGDCIPPHIDSHDFLRPFCTVSFLSECNIVFGTNLKVVDAGVFTGATAIPLPLGSVLVINGNGADVAKHCVPSVPKKRISITFRRMDESKRPVGYVPEPDLQGLQPLSVDAEPSNKSIFSTPRHSLKKVANHRENGEKAKGSTERSSESRYSNRSRRGPPSRRSFMSNLE